LSISSGSREIVATVNPVLNQCANLAARLMYLLPTHSRGC
jgi:hypothetical protein